MTTVVLRKDIQVMRAIAVLAVMVFHFDATLLPGGFVGVDIFLVISGYLIASILLRLRDNAQLRLHQVLLKFYSTRLRRIVPAYLLMLVVTTVAAAVLFLPNDFAIFRKSLSSALWFNSNQYFASFGDYFAPASHEQPLLHTWSLAVEIQFYMLAPLLLLLIPVDKLRWILLTLALVFTAVAEYRLRFLNIEQATYYSLLARLPAFFIGALAYTLAERSHRIRLAHSRLIVVLAWGLIGLSLCRPNLGGYFPGAAGLVPVIGAALLLAFNPKLPAEVIYSNSLFVWLGDISYSLYLWHWPVLAFLRYYSGEMVLGLEFGLVFAGLTLLCATTSYYFVEMQLRKGMGWRQLPRAGLLVAMLVLALVGAQKVNQELTPVLPVEFTRYADPESICHGKLVSDCLKGDLGAAREVLVLGDSHAAMLNHYFDYLGKQLSFKARIITASSCVTIPGFEDTRLPEWSRSDCSAQIDAAKQHLKKGIPLFLAASWAWQLENPIFLETLKNFLRQNALGGVYILGQEPLLNGNPLRNHRFLALGLSANTSLSNKHVEANRVLQALATQVPSVAFIDLSRLNLFKQVPFWHGTLIYYDEHHLNEVGVNEYARQSIGIFEKIIKN